MSQPRSTLQMDADPAPSTRPARSWPVVAAAAFGAAVTVIQQAGVVPLFPRLQTELGASVTSVSWTFTISMLVGAVATPLMSRLGDMYGRHRMLLLSYGLLLAGSVIAGLATSLPVLLAGRVVQALSMAVIPLSIAAVRGVLPRERMATGIGVISATIGIGSGLGMVLSGVVAEYTTGFRAVFWMIAGLALIALLLGAFVVRDPTPPLGGRLDLPGALLLTGGLVSLLLAITQGQAWGWTSGRILGLFAGSALLFVLWVRVERRSPDPLVAIDLLTHRGTIGASGSSLLLGFAMFGGFMVIPQFVQAPEALGYGFGASVLVSGLYMFPTSLVMMLVSFGTGGLIRRFSAPVVVAAGAALTGLSELWLVLSHDRVLDIVLAMTLLGLGIGLGYSAMATMAIEHVAPERTGIASGVNTVVRLIGGSIGGAVAAAVLAANPLPGSPVPAESGYQLVFGVAAAGAALAMLFAAGFGLTNRRAR